MAGPERAIIVADGEVDLALLRTLTTSEPSAGSGDPRRGPPALLDAPRPLVVAADGGAERCLGLGIVPDVVVGDLDSLSAEAQDRLRALGVEVRAAPRDKDESDMELCLLLVRDRGAKHVTVIGALGLVRPEHSIANLLLLADTRFDELPIDVAGHGSRTWRIGTASGPGEARLSGLPGDFVSLFALDTCVEGVSSEGLRFPLRNESLPLGPSRGLSNELLTAEARVLTRRGRLVLVHTDRGAESHFNEPRED